MSHRHSASISALVVLSLLGAAALMGCSGAVSERDPGTGTGTGSGTTTTQLACELDGVVYADGASVPSADGCNACSCSNGMVACTEMACVPTTCDVGGVAYQVGERVEVEDATCECGADGQLTACVPTGELPGCYVDGIPRAFGAALPSSDCNSCRCGAGGNIECTTMECGASCSYNGQVYAEGASFPSEDGCNSCGCSGGMVSCTERACAVEVCKTDADCDDGSYCKSQSGCGTPGICEVKSQACTLELAPVCGCDGNDYSTSCAARAAGVTVAYDGECGALTCEVGGVLYPDGATGIGVEGTCNTCSCVVGLLYCTQRACLD